MTQETDDAFSDWVQARLAATTPGSWYRYQGSIYTDDRASNQRRVVYYAGWPPAIPNDADIEFFVQAREDIQLLLKLAKRVTEATVQRNALRAVLAETLEYIKGDYEGANWRNSAAGELYTKGMQLLGEPRPDPP